MARAGMTKFLAGLISRRNFRAADCSSCRCIVVGNDTSIHLPFLLRLALCNSTSVLMVSRCKIALSEGDVDAAAAAVAAAVDDDDDVDVV